MDEVTEPQETDAQAIKRIMTEVGVARHEAEFILALERGEITGDIQRVDENGDPIPTPALRPLP